MPQAALTQLYAAEGLAIPLRVLDGYKILQVSTGKPADLAQAWSTPLTAEGDTAALDSRTKSVFSTTAQLF